jgi:hypothetical protein
LYAPSSVLSISPWRQQQQSITHVSHFPSAPSSVSARSPYLLRGDRGKLLLAQLVERLFVVTQIRLGAHEDERHARRVVADLGQPLGLDVLERSATAAQQQ